MKTDFGVQKKNQKSQNWITSNEQGHNFFHSTKMINRQNSAVLLIVSITSALYNSTAYVAYGELFSCV